MITWKTIGKKKIPEPVKGLNEDFDIANENVEKLKKKIDDYLEDVRKELKNRSISYTTGSSRFRYEIEIPDDFTKKVPDHYINTSNAKGRKRYQTDELRGMIEDLEEKED